MKIAFFGTPDFSAKILEEILNYSEIDIKLVVSQPDKHIGRKQELQATSVKQGALENNLNILQPEKIRNNKDFLETLKSLELDFIVVVAYGKIIPKEILEIPKFGCINIHGSILPKYRGASPVQAAIKNGEQETGLTIMYMSEGMDEGDMLSIAKIDMDNVDTSEDIFRKFIEIGPKLLINTLKKIQAGEIQAVPQNDSEATYCGKINKEDGEVFFRKQNAQEIYNTFRAYTPWPGIFTFYEGKRLVLEKIILGDRSDLQDVITFQTGLTEGKIIKLSKNRYGIVCSDLKILELKQVKLEGKKSLDIESFVNGNKGFLEYIFE